MKILLINPKAEEDIVNNLPLGLCYLAAALESKGFDVDICDLNSTKTMEDLYLTLVNDVGLVGITVCSDSCETVCSLAKIVKKVSPQSFVVVGGPHATFAYKEILESHFEVDYAIIGQGETVICELAEAIQNKTDVSLIKSVAYRGRNNKVVIAGKSEAPPQNILPERQLTENPVLRAKRKGTKIIIGEVLAASGCIGHCTFCAANVLADNPCRWRARTIETIEKDIRSLVSCGVNAVYFVDNDFLSSYELAEEILEVLDRIPEIKGIFITVRVDSLLKSRELLDRCFSRGILGIEIGVESGSDAALRRYGKGITVEQNKEAVKLLLQYRKLYRFSISIDMVFCDPFGTYEEIKRNFSFLVENGLTGKAYENALFTELALLRGSTLWIEAEKQGMIGKDIGTPFVAYRDRSVENIHAWIALYKEVLLPRVQKVRKKLDRAMRKNDKCLQAHIIRDTIICNQLSYRYVEEIIDCSDDREKSRNIFESYSVMLEKIMKDYDEYQF